MTSLAAVPDRPDTTALVAESSEIVVQARALTITSVESYTFAIEFGKGIKALQKRIVDKFAPHKKRAHDAWKGLCDDERSDLQPTEEAERIIKDKVLTYQRAERQRIDAEVRQREQLARKLEEERRIQQAIDREEDGDSEGANQILDEPIHTVPVAVARPVAPKIAGAASTRRWTFTEPVDLAAVIKHVAGIPQDQPLAHPELLNMLALDTKTTRQLVTAMKAQFKVPGIHAFEAEGLSLGSGR